MSVITSLRWLTEPAYIRLGPTFDDDLSDYFARLRSRSLVLAELTQRGRPTELLARLVQAGYLLELPAGDESDTCARLGALTISTPPSYQTSNSIDYDFALFPIPGRSDRAVAVSRTTAETLAAARGTVLAAAVATSAALHGTTPVDFWRGVLHDLTGVLLEGVATLDKPDHIRSSSPLAQESS